MLSFCCLTDALGHAFNGEPLDPHILSGAALILTGLVLFEFGDRVKRL
ncbi:MAG: hypothetical protein WD601_09215 [Pseudohongiellaceae bacterium]